MESQYFLDYIAQIRDKYSIQKYQLLSRDRRLEHVPAKLEKLWYSDGLHNIATCNMYYYYLRYREGFLPEAALDLMLQGLEAAFACEFKRFEESNFKRKEEIT